MNACDWFMRGRSHKLRAISVCSVARKEFEAYYPSLSLPPPRTYRGQLDVDQHGLAKDVLVVVAVGFGLLVL